MHFYYKQYIKRSSITGGLVTMWLLCLNFSQYTIRTVLRRTSDPQTCFQLPLTLLLIRGNPCTHMLTCTHVTMVVRWYHINLEISWELMVSIGIYKWLHSLSHLSHKILWLIYFNIQTTKHNQSLLKLYKTGQLGFLWACHQLVFSLAVVTFYTF